MKKRQIWICFLLYLALLAYLLFFAEALGRRGQQDRDYRYNLVMFQEIGRYYRIWKGKGNPYLFLTNVVGNIAVFVPAGIFLRILLKRCQKSICYTTLLCLELSLTVELIQLVTKVGSFDVDDLLLNTAGGFLGCLLLEIWRRVHGKKKL